MGGDPPCIFPVGQILNLLVGVLLHLQEFVVSGPGPDLLLGIASFNQIQMDFLPGEHRCRITNDAHPAGIVLIGSKGIAVMVHCIHRHGCPVDLDEAVGHLITESSRERWAAFICPNKQRIGFARLQLHKARAAQAVQCQIAAHIAHDLHRCLVALTICDHLHRCTGRRIGIRIVDRADQVLAPQAVAYRRHAREVVVEVIELDLTTNRIVGIDTFQNEQVHLIVREVQITAGIHTRTVIAALVRSKGLGQDIVNAEALVVAFHLQAAVFAASVEEHRTFRHFLIGPEIEGIGFSLVEPDILTKIERVLPLLRAKAAADNRAGVNAKTGRSRTDRSIRAGSLTGHCVDQIIPAQRITDTVDCIQILRQAVHG